MSAHSCNELCEIDEKFHEIQKTDYEFRGLNASKDEMKNLLTRKIIDLHELFKKLL